MIDLYLLHEIYLKKVIVENLEVRLERHIGIFLFCEIGECFAKVQENFVFVVLVILK